MAKEAYYFSHDSNASRDPKCSALINDFGFEGYGIFWMIIEILSEQENYKLRKFNKLYEGLARQIWIDADKLRSIIESMLNDYELLLQDDNFIWSESLLKRMKIKEDKRNKKVEAGRKGGVKSGESRSKHTKQNEAVLEANEPKESKVKESKGNKEDIYIAHFDQFWNIYPSKKGKEKARAKFISYGNKIDIEKVLEGTKKYTAYCKAKDRTLMDGSTFVNNQSWSDDWELTTNVSQFPSDKRKEFLEAQKEARTKDYGPKDIPEYVRSGL